MRSQTYINSLSIVGQSPLWVVVHLIRCKTDMLAERLRHLEGLELVTPGHFVQVLGSGPVSIASPRNYVRDHVLVHLLQLDSALGVELVVLCLKSMVCRVCDRGVEQLSRDSGLRLQRNKQAELSGWFHQESELRSPHNAVHH